MEVRNGRTPMMCDYKLVYEDSYCFGRVLLLLTQAYNENIFFTCFNFEKNKKEN